MERTANETLAAVGGFPRSQENIKFLLYFFEARKGFYADGLLAQQQPQFLRRYRGLRVRLKGHDLTLWLPLVQQGQTLLPLDGIILRQGIHYPYPRRSSARSRWQSGDQMQVAPRTGVTVASHFWLVSQLAYSHIALCIVRLRILPMWVVCPLPGCT